MHPLRVREKIKYFIADDNCCPGISPLLAPPQGARSSGGDPCRLTEAPTEPAGENQGCHRRQSGRFIIALTFVCPTPRRIGRRDIGSRRIAAFPPRADIRKNGKNKKDPLKSLKKHPCKPGIGIRRRSGSRFLLRLLRLLRNRKF